MMKRGAPDNLNEEISEEATPLPVRVGTMGWSYQDWYGPFYPAGTPSRDALSAYARAFDIVEIDSTFYGTPPDSSVRHWHKFTPDVFLFCPKFPRAITHDAKLTDVREPVQHFVQTMALLGPKRGPMLLQMGPDFTRADLPALQAFLPHLHELDDPDARFAIEFRHRSLIGPDISALLKEHHIALAVTDYVAMPRRFEITTDFIYMRLIGRHGAFDHHRYAQADRTPDMLRWTTALQTHRPQYTAAYVFCNDDYEGHAPHTANRFKTLLGLPTIERPPDLQGTLF